MQPQRLKVERSAWQAGAQPERPEPRRAPPPAKRMTFVRRFLREIAFAQSRRFREKRAAQFRAAFRLREESRVLDLGGFDGEHIRMVLAGTPVRPENIYVADVNEQALDRARAYGHRTALLAPDGKVPFPDRFFDVAFCSSVIEHVTVPKSEVWQHRDEEFGRKAVAHQRAFADEISRVSKAFWVQTPAREFFLETHSWLPFVGWLPRGAQLAVLGVTRRFWLSRHTPDWYLLTRGHMEAMFPGARIRSERWLGMTKSWIALRRD